MTDRAETFRRRIYALHRGNGEHILLVDDDPGCLSCVGDMLERLCYKVRRYGTARAAAEAMLSRVTTGDLVITDYRMEGMDGLELLHTLRTAGISIPVIVLTGCDDLTVYLKAATHRDVLYAEKPVTLEGLSEAVKNALTERRCTSG